MPIRIDQTQRRRKVRLQALTWSITVLLAVGVFLLVRWSGLAINTVQTSSMVPTYSPTDMVIALSPQRVTPKVGEAIVFDTTFGGTYIPWHVHRIVGQNPDGTWITQGDANSESDPWRVEPSHINGVVVYSIPGWILRDPRILGALLFLVLVIGFWPRAAKEQVPPYPVCVDLLPDLERVTKLKQTSPGDLTVSLPTLLTAETSHREEDAPEVRSVSPPRPRE